MSAANQATQKIAKLLRAKEGVILNLCKKMARLTKKENVLEEVTADNERLVKERLAAFGLKLGADACQIYSALLEKTKATDRVLAQYFHHPDFTRPERCQVLLDKVKAMGGAPPGLFLKKQKVEFLLRANPPLRILQALGYKDIEELLTKEDVWQVFCALRFMEERRWLNDVFFKPYQSLKADDFEERLIQVLVLDEEWLVLGEQFAGKKLHHLSHLKELGIIFILPFSANYPGAVLEVLSLMLHYFHEVSFYSRIFKNLMTGADFGPNLVRALQGQVSSEPLVGRKITWRIIQRYLAKEDPTDPRLLEPHVNPEAIHWRKAEDDLARFAQEAKLPALEFWTGLDFVGDFFAMPRGYACPLDGLDHRVVTQSVTLEMLKNGFSEILVSFDLIDNLTSLCQQCAVESKYLYHQQEALWNEIFIRYLSQKRLEDLILENLDKGMIEL